MYQLKKGAEEFRVVDGPFAGRKFERGKVYAEIPAGEAERFERVEVSISRILRRESYGGQEGAKEIKK